MRKKGWKQALALAVAFGIMAVQIVSDHSSAGAAGQASQKAEKETAGELADVASGGALEEQAKTDAAETMATSSKTSEGQAVEDESADEAIQAAEEGSGSNYMPESGQEIDYGKLIQETSDEDYRESVEIQENTLVVVRQEGEDALPIEEEEWYQEIGAGEYEAISEDWLTQADGSQDYTVTYKITVPAEDVWAVVDFVNETNEVLIAEPEYIYYTCESDVPSESDNAGMSKEWYLNDQGASTIWADSESYGNATGEGVVVAVIDTGVDYTHEDLKENIWMNTAEVFGEDGVDDDGNGYVDDVYGVNYIDGSTNPMDDNGHGTHVAGIIAMADNSYGGVGLAYHASIMSIKAGGSDGTFNSSDIAKAIKYAYSNGADVINMSFGSYAHSAVVEQALQDAFASCVLVAAAGNDGYPTADAPIIPNGNMYPASYSYVIGVMAYDKNSGLASFSNWDYEQNYGAEYEIVAPGVEIYSTLPGNRYASWSGTSMAAPMVSAAAAILRSSYSDKEKYSSRYIMGQLVSATEETITYNSIVGKSYQYSKLDLADSITKKAKPNINVDTVYIFDSPELSEVNNGDGIVQPGETIDIAVGLRNQWGAATDVYVTVNATSDGGVENSYVTFEENEVQIDDIGTFGTQDNGYVYSEEGTVTGVSNPIRVTVSADAPNDANITFHVNYRAKNALDESDETVYTQKEDTLYTVSVQNGTVLEGKIAGDTTLTKDKYYIVKNSLLIPQGVTVTVEPGTKIQFWSTDSQTVYADTNIAYIQVQGNLYLYGTEADPIELFPGKDFEAYRVQVEESGNGKIYMEYTSITNPYIDITEGNHLSLMQDYDYILYRDYNTLGETQSYEGYARVKADVIENSKISSLRGRDIYSNAEVSGSFDTVLFDNCQVSYNGIKASNCTFLGNQGRVEDSYSGTLEYHSSSLTNVGNMYRTPQYTAATSIHTLNGKKYIIYKFDNFFYEDSYDYTSQTWHTYGYENFKALLTAIEKNNGTLSVLDTDIGEDWRDASDDSDEMKLLTQMYEEIGEQYLQLTVGAYYDRDTEGVVVTNDSSTDSFSMLSDSSPLCYFSIYKATGYVGTDDDGNSILQEYTDANPYSVSDMMTYVLAEYPESVDDYTVTNPAIDVQKLGIMESTYFTGNAILNRLTSLDLSDWMRLTSGYKNTYTFMATGNYWGTTDETLVQKQVIDFDTNIRYADYIISPYLEAPADTTYPCVSEVYLLDANGERVQTVGNGNVEVHVIFNRAMDTTVSPMVTYGPDDPYTDYTVTGAWQSATEWVGTATVKVLVNQGQQYIRVKDAVAADDAWLSTGTDWGRFTFNIAATGAEALTLQAEGLAGGISLSWMQDDYDTLAGYNIYRSESGEEGSYAKVNPSIISGDTKYYSDTGVLSGKKYYYYFTVVDTDLTESKPSNVVQCASLDDELPVIAHTPVTSLTYGVNASFTATVTDNVGVNSVTLFYRMKGEEQYQQASMVCTNDSSYSVQIPAKQLSVGTLEYYIAAADSVAYAYAGNAAEPYTCEVETTAKILTVESDGGSVGNTIAAKVNGVNLTEDMEVYVDGQKADSSYVSGTEIDFTFVPETMGSKTVELYQDGKSIAYKANAVAVRDESVTVTNEKTILVGGKNWQSIYFTTNYVGKLSKLEITYSMDNSNVWPVNGCTSSEDTYDDEAGTRTYTFRMNTTLNGGRLFYLNVYDPEDIPEITSVKINGVEVAGFTMNQEMISVIAEDQYVAVESVTLNNTAYTLEVGESFTPEYTVMPSNATMREMVSYSYDPSSLQYNGDGSFTAVSSGTYSIGLSVDNVYADSSIYVQVNAIAVTGMAAERSLYTGVVGDVVTIKLNAEPAESDAEIWWSYDGTYVQQISTEDRGRTTKFLLNQAGNCTLTAYTGDSTVSCSVTVEILENTAYPEMTDETLTMYPNQTYQETVVVRNQNSGESAVKYSSSNTAVAKVSDEGLISAVGSGYAVITASIDGGAKTDSLIVLVGTDSMSYSAGDLNMDGQVTSTDAMLALKLALSAEVRDVFLKIGDVNGDGALTSSDAMMILQYVTGLIKEFSAGTE